MANDGRQFVDAPGTLWDGAEIISTYTRADMIRDGLMADVTPWAAEIGFSVPVGISDNSGLFTKTAGTPNRKGWYRPDGVRNVRALLWAALNTIRAGKKSADEVRFPWAGETVICRCHGGDSGEPVITLMLPADD